MWYRRHECGLRMAIFFSAATAAGAFGGLLAFGIMKMDGAGNLEGWSWIFILEVSYPSTSCFRDSEAMSLITW